MKNIIKKKKKAYAYENYLIFVRILLRSTKNKVFKLKHSKILIDYFIDQFSHLKS